MRTDKRMTKGLVSLLGLAAALLLIASSGCSSSCPTGSTMCGSVCVHTMTDSANCGACGKACPSGQVCSAGNCELECTGGTTQCGGKCTNTLNDPANCGACGFACSSGLVCSVGKCGLQCSGGTTLCTQNCIAGDV